MQPGDLLDNNTVKKEKRYYAGKLLFSPSTVTFSLKSGVSPTVTVTTDNGKAVPMPSTTWDDRSGIYVSVGSESIADSRLSSWQLSVDASTKPVGTYRLYLYSVIAERDAWEYSGYVTVKVVE